MFSNYGYDPTQFQFLGAAQPAAAPWYTPPTPSPVSFSVDRQMPIDPVAAAAAGGFGDGMGIATPNSSLAGGGPGMWSAFQQWMKDSGMLGSTDANGMKTDGWGSLALGGAQSLANLWMGMQQLGIAKDQLRLSKDSFNKNFEAQRKTTNTALMDRQAARVASNPTAYESVGDYMKKNGV